MFGKKKAAKAMEQLDARRAEIVETFKDSVTVTKKIYAIDGPGCATACYGIAMSLMAVCAHQLPELNAEKVFTDVGFDAYLYDNVARTYWENRQLNA